MARSERHATNLRVSASLKRVAFGECFALALGARHPPRCVLLPV